MDRNGNESGFALVTPGTTTGVAGEGPLTFVLRGAWPNPGRTNRLDVEFALPVAGRATIDLMDVSGRRVVGREVGSLGVGRHSLNLAEGRDLAPGIYFVRLTQGVNVRTVRAALIN